MTKRKPRPHQREAVRTVVAGLRTLVATANFKNRMEGKGHFSVTTIRLTDGDPCGLVTEIIRDGMNHVRHNACSWSREDCLDFIERVKSNERYEFVSHRI